MSAINVIGLGYIGLPTALMFASHGVKVVGSDIDLELVNTLRAGQITFEEPGLAKLFDDALAQGIEFTTDYIKTDIYIVAVPTPYEKENKKIDPRYVISAFKSILEVCLPDTIIVLESTISPGTIDKYIKPVIMDYTSSQCKHVHLVHAPERILPGNMIYELINNPRTVGTDNSAVGERVKALYQCFCRAEIVVTDIRTAEMTKVVENTYRDINIAFANELAKICRFDGMDVYEIIKIANMHPRVNILQPGPGVGGHCISVDPWFLVGDYPGLANIILAARRINDSMPEFVLGRIRDVMKAHGIKEVGRVGLYGLTYKEDVDDVRESPTLQLLESMQTHLATGIKVFDPFIKEALVDNQYFNLDDFLESIDLLVIMVAHSHIKENLTKIKSKVILDTRNVVPFTNIYKL